MIRKSRMSKWLAVTALMLWAGSALAEPGPMITYLMSQPTSIFSFGMLRMQAQLDALQSRLSIVAAADYDWDRNRIEITISQWNSPDISQGHCKALIDNVREYALVNPHTGVPVFNNASLYAGYFSQIGFELKNAPKKLSAEIDKIIEVHVELATSGQMTRCEGPLLSDRVMYEEEPKPLAPSSAGSKRTN